ncbi:MAG: wax ester/triacylglycerol synthase domain-containing protein [Acidimicrobiia bacterium]
MASRMNHAEAIMWAVESDPFLRSDFTNVTVLSTPPDSARLRRSVTRAIASYPPLRQRVVGSPLGLAPPLWGEDPDFDLDYHLRRVALPPPGTHRQLLDLAAVLAATPLDRARPLWELTVVEGLDSGRSAVLQRLHHSLTDGVGAMKLARSLFERVPPEGAGTGPAPAWAPVANPLVWRRPEVLSPADLPPPGAIWPADAPAVPLGSIAGALGFRLGQTIAAARRGFEVASALPWRSGDDLLALAGSAGRTARSAADQVLVSGGALSPLLVGRSLGRYFATASLELAGVRRAARALGGGRNDIFVAGVTGALLDYHQRMGAPCEALRMATAISLRTGTGPTGGNHFAPARGVMPIGPKDPAARLAATRRRLAALAAEPGISLAEFLASVLSLVPAGLLAPALRAQARTVDFATSIVPGLRGRRWVAGAPVEGSWPIGPRLGCAANFTLASCGDRLGLGINLDPVAFSDPGAFVECLGDSFDALLDVQ